MRARKQGANPREDSYGKGVHWSAEATRMADDWWAHQQGLRQTLRTEVAVGQKGPDAQLDQWAITIRYENENPRQ
jgi:hypothetical protein